jgi:transcriptional regulator with XRE-family HTH domain
MDSFGEILHNTRVQKNLDLDKVAREISIDKRYLQGLEEEDNSVFPGEAYMIGFLRNYSNYLELNTELMLKLYNNKKIQESPVPVELISPPKPTWLMPAVIIPAALVFLVILIVSILLIRKSRMEDDPSVVVSSKVQAKQYDIGDAKITERVYKGDQFLFPSDNGPIVLTVRETRSSFGLDTPSGVFYTDLADEQEVDINGDSVPDLIIYVSDLSYTDETRGVEVSILARHGVASSTTTDVYVEDIPFIADVKNTHPQKVLLEDNRPYPFTINASFISPCLFRDKVDFSDSVETYFTKGEVFTANPHNAIRLWLSNSESVKINIVADTKTYSLDIGKAGHVLVEDIKWIKDNEGRYRLVVFELD